MPPDGYYPPPSFWAVVGDLCQQAARERADWPHRKVVDLQLTVAEAEELRLAYVHDGGLE